MNNIWLIVQREYLIRVRKKSFLIMSILGPILFGAIMFVPALITVFVSDDEKRIAIVDESGLFRDKFESSKSLIFSVVPINIDEAKTALKEKKYDGVLLIPDIDLSNPQGFTYFSEESLAPMTKANLERTIRQEIEELRMMRSGIKQEQLDSIRAKVDITTIKIGEEGEKASSSGAAMVIGYVGAFFIYIFIFLYGSQIMRGVMEEKTNRIIEVLICSVRPFDLMMGKIIGIGAVALTQFLIWVVLSLGITTGVSMAFGLDKVAEARAKGQMEQLQQNPEMANAVEVSNAMDAIASINMPVTIAAFLFFFFAGYLMYGAMFAAIGAAVDNETDSQQFMLPITIPLIFAIISLSAVIANPNGQLAFWLSVVPLTAPVVMMARVPFTGANWELFLSMGILIASFIGMVWLAGRIYRVGILMYGKKPTYKEIGKWLFYKA
ncbi:ABC transporter permease [Rhodoflexus caldus]|uniref:ABC transporter permease n=1 Tax=Rhodoflexus caldus TaxID=2891236 RepID=UPI00202A5BA9|nr:ABC transporter permease [Rhodoflexus caldus]